MVCVPTSLLEGSIEMQAVKAENSAKRGAQYLSQLG